MRLSVVEEDQSPVPAPRIVTIAEPEPLLVLKFGSSVLRTIDDLRAVAGEIYRQRRNGNRIIAVVSALEGETDRLFLEAERACDGASCSGAAELVSLGEDRTAALLRIACERIGIESAICRAEELGLRTEGEELDSTFVSFAPFVLLRKLEAKGVVIVPGFVGSNDAGERSLLGRGGSDFTAAILGGELGAKTIRLYKDVDGVFDQDPALVPSARKFEEISYDNALRVAGTLVHSKAVEFAAQRGLPIEVEAIGSSTPTRIAAASSEARKSGAGRPLRIALAGYGVVGQALAKRLARDPRFEIAAILIRDDDRKRDVPPPVALTDDLHIFSKAEADVLVELLSCEMTAAALCSNRLCRGIPVITASKRVVSNHFAALSASAGAGGARLLYSAAVGGGAPILEAIDRVKRQGEIAAVRGILNGTVNFVLERLSQGMALSDALDLARAKGFAEEDCEADLSGADAAAKLRIIAGRAFGVSPEEIEVETERLDAKLAKTIEASGERWVQVSEVSLNGGKIEASVRFATAAEARIRAGADEWNFGLVRLACGREIAIAGRGAGGAATAEAVLADLYDLLADRGARANEDDKGLNLQPTGLEASIGAGHG